MYVTRRTKCKRRRFCVTHHRQNLIVLICWFVTLRQCGLFVCLGVICTNSSFAFKLTGIELRPCSECSNTMICHVFRITQCRGHSNYAGNVASKQTCSMTLINRDINPLNAELNPICHLLALLLTYHILHVCRIRVNPYKQWHYTVYGHKKQNAL